MKHVVNILLLGVVLLGVAMMADTPWGLGVAWLLSPFGGSFPVFHSQKYLGCCYLLGRDRLLPVASCFGCRGSVWANMVYRCCAVSI